MKEEGDRVRAVTIPRYGGIDVLTVAAIPEPMPAPGEVVVRVVAAAVNPTDVLLRRGLQAKFLGEIHPPFVPGMDFCGIVEALGADDSEFRVGTPVIGAMSAWRPGGGAQAEIICVPAASMVMAPSALSATEASTLPMNGLTASASLTKLDLPVGGSVVVVGAAGAVGGLAVELAVDLGLNVVAVAGDRDREVVEKMGAHHFVAQGKGAFDEVRHVFPDGVDGLIDAANVGSAVLRAVRDQGRVVRMMPYTEETEREITVDRVFVVDNLSDTAALRHIRDMANRGTVTARVAAELPVDEVRAAHELIERKGSRGRPVLVF